MGETNGIGLGLSTTKILVEAQEGKVEIESENGIYTKVTFSIVVETQKKKKKDIKAENFFDQLKMVQKSEEAQVVSKKSGNVENQSEMKNIFGGKVEEKFEKVPLLEFDKPSKRQAAYLEDPNNMSEPSSKSKKSSKRSSKSTVSNDSSQIKPLSAQQFDDLEKAQNLMHKKKI